MKLKTLTLFLLSSIVFSVHAQTVWHDPLTAPGEPAISGRAWNEEIGASYNRMPDRLKDQLPQSVWRLQQQSAGLKVRFRTNADTILVHYTTKNQAGGLVNLTPLACSGVDLYATDEKGQMHWIGCHMKWKMHQDDVTFTFADITPDGPSHRDVLYTLYLPSYNGVRQLGVGVDQADRFEFVLPSDERPVVIYGSSIVQGASPSRIGLMFTNIVERRLGVPIVNLGFSGSAFLEPGLFKALGEINARAYVIDAIPNSYKLPADSIVSRVVKGVRQLRSRSSAPILLVESGNRPDSIFHRNIHLLYIGANAQLRKAYHQLQREGVKKLYYLPARDIGIDDNSMIEGMHPNDLGNMEYADAYVKALRKILKKS